MIINKTMNTHLQLGVPVPIGGPPKDGIGGAAMGGIAGIGGAAIGAGARPAGGVGAVKLLGAWAASRGSSAPQPRQNL